jgi:hypothetical protein
MFSSLNRTGRRIWKRALVFALAGAVLSGILTPATVAARENRTPYVVPGDQDGPAGVQEAVPVAERFGDILPVYLPAAPCASGFCWVRVDPSWRAVWFGPARAKPIAVEHPKR